MGLFQAALFPMHWILDSRIVNREVADEGGFFQLHRLYLAFSTAQWCATLGYIWATLVLWRPAEPKKAEYHIMSDPLMAET